MYEELINALHGIYIDTGIFEVQDAADVICKLEDELEEMTHRNEKLKAEVNKLNKFVDFYKELSEKYKTELNQAKQTI